MEEILLTFLITQIEYFNPLLPDKNIPGVTNIQNKNIVITFYNFCYTVAFVKAFQNMFPLLIYNHTVHQTVQFLTHDKVINHCET